MEVAGAHNLKLSYESKCSNIHGHNWIITVFCKNETLNQDGMIVDFKHIKTMISDKLDHQYINDVVDFNPTAENMAKWIHDLVPFCYKVSVQESEGNIAIFKEEQE
jgi:6-pyruvoyltetrahydropterin/6-carboxytetrahydropterin synthase